MSCRHDLANGTCSRCYAGTIDPGPEEDYGPNLDGPGARSAHEAAFDVLPKPRTRPWGFARAVGACPGRRVR